MVVGKRSPACGSCDVLPTAAAEVALNTTLDMLLSRSLCCYLCCTHTNSQTSWKKLKLNFAKRTVCCYCLIWFALGFACSLCFPFGSSWSFDTLHKNESLRPKPSCFVPFTTSTATATTARDALRWPRCGTRALSRCALPLSCCYLCAAAPGKLSAQVERERAKERERGTQSERDECVQQGKARQESAPSIELPDALSGTAHALPFSLSLLVCLISRRAQLGVKLTQCSTWVWLKAGFHSGLGFFPALPFWLSQDQLRQAQRCPVFLSLSPFLPPALSISFAGFWHASNLISVLINLAKLDDRTPYRVGIGPHFGVQLTHTPLFISAGTGNGIRVGRSPSGSRPLKRNALACACHQAIDSSSRRRWGRGRENDRAY